MKRRVALLVWGFLVGVSSAQAPSVDELVATRNREGVLAYETGRYDDAILAFDSARALDGRSEVIGRNLSRALHARGQDLVKAARPAAAAVDFRRALELDPKESRIALSLVGVLRPLGLTAEARGVLRKSLLHEPEAGGLWEARGHLEYAEEDLVGAIASFEAALKFSPTRGQEIGAWLEKLRRELEVEGRYFSETRGMFTVKYDTESVRGTSVAVLDLLERLHGRLEAEFRLAPGRRITVVLYSRADFDLATGAQEWAGGLFDGKIRLPVRNFRQVAREVEATLAHELAHVFVECLGVKCPLWLNEGIAQHFEGKALNPRARQDLVRRRAESTLPALSEIPANWAPLQDRLLVGSYYAMGLSMTSYLMDRFGWLPLRDLVQALGRGESLEAAAERLFGERWSATESHWRESLR